jgi:hypothetical protein
MSDHYSMRTTIKVRLLQLALAVVAPSCLYLLPASTCFGDCIEAADGLVAWWPAEGNAYDSVNLNVGTFGGGTNFVSGRVGRAFSFNGTNAFINVPASASLNVGAGGSFTIEAWINPSNVSQAHPLLQWNANPPISTAFGVSFWISVPPTNGGTGPGCLLIDVKDSGIRHRMVCTSPGTVVSAVWQHVAATYNHSDGTASLYLNGTMILQTNIGIVTPFTAQDLWIGYERDQILNDKLYSIGDGQAWYAGLMDELSIYNRVLSDTEIQSVFTAGSAGKCPVAPTLAVIQPDEQSVAEGEPGTFTLIASGSPPLSFQWSFNGTNILGATNTALIFTNIQLTDAGNYSVQVANSVGSIASVNAVLTVLPSYAPTWAQTTAPTNLSWTCVASSADGRKLAATAYEGFIYTSSDAGKTWISNTVPQLTWHAVASSADGIKLAAAAVTLATIGAPAGAIYVSTNSGATWQLSTVGSWRYIVSSTDGNSLAAIGGSGGDLYHIYTSSNAGISWSKFSAPGFGLGRITCSADGSKIVGTDLYNNIYATKNFGVTWNLTGAPNTNCWTSVAFSADGDKLVAVAMYDSTETSTNALIFSSADSGTNWSATGAPKQRWNAVACSADGTKLVAGVYGYYGGPGGYLYVSTDFGTNWTTTRAPAANWSSVASSADGTQLVAAQSPGSIYLWRPTALDISLSGNNMTISWPTNVPGFILQQKDDLTSADWLNVTNIPFILGSQYQVILPLSGNGRMFRLMYP